MKASRTSGGTKAQRRPNSLKPLEGLLTWEQGWAPCARCLQGALSGPGVWHASGDRQTRRAASWAKWRGPGTGSRR